MAEIVPFPLARRRAYIMRQALWFANQRHKAAESYLRHQLSIQADALTRRGVAPARVKAEVTALEAAIRIQATRLMLTPGGAA
jgi:hypothetical protein